MSPIDVPSLDALVADPSKAAHLSPDVAWSLLAGLAGMLPMLIAASSTRTADSSGAPERFLTVEQAASQFSVSAQWLYRHKRQLPHSQPSRKVLLFPEDKLRTWFAHRKNG